MLISRPMTKFITNLVKVVICSELNPLNAELNPICHLLALLGGATIVVVSRLRVKSWEIQINTDEGVINLPSVLKKGERSTSHVMFSIQSNWESLPQIVRYRLPVRSWPYITQGSSKLDTQMVVRIRSLHPDQG